MKYPFFVPFIFISLGIIFKNLLSIEIPLIILLILALILIIAKNEMAIIILSLFSFFIGYYLYEKDFLNIQNKKNAILQCNVIDIPAIYKKQVKFNCKVKDSNDKNLVNKTLKVIIFSKNPEKLDIFLFSELDLKGRLKLYKNSIYLYVKNYRINNQKNPFIYLFKLKKKLKENFREKVKDKILYSVGEALIFGDRGNIDNDTRRIFINSGLIHLLAISGLHVGMLITILLLIFYPLKREIKYSLVASLVAVFPLITGLKIPVIRASLMGVLFLIGKLKNFKINSLNILFFVGTVILILSPKSIFTPSFQLSFMAVLGILLFVEKHKLEVKNIYQFFYAGIIISIVATLFTTPILAYHFGKFSPVSIIATPIALIPLYPYILLAVINLLTGFQIDFFIKLMNKFGEVFLGITAIFGDLNIFYLGYKPLLIFTVLTLIFLVAIFLTDAGIFPKILISTILLIVFLYISKSEELSEFKVIDNKKFLLLKLNKDRECFLYLKRKNNFINLPLNKEGCEKIYLIINPRKKLKSSLRFDGYIPLNSKFRNIQFIKVGKDIFIKFNDDFIYPLNKRFKETN